jgi:hypothetical protein
MSEGVKFCSECGTAVAKSNKPATSTVLVDDRENVAKMLEYLSDVIYCETSLIAYDSIIQGNYAAVARLCVPHSLPEPPQKPVQPEEKDPSVKGRAAKAGIATASLFTPAAPIGVIALGVQAYGRKKDLKNAKAEYEQEMEQYNQNLIEHEKHLTTHRKMLDEEKMRLSVEAAQVKLYEAQSDRVTKLASHAKETLSALYGTNILHTKYQNLVAAASIYDYLSTGRTSSLVRIGNDPGAYNIYEDDVRVGRIVNVIGKVGSQIIGAVNNMSSDIRSMNRSVCSAIDNAVERNKSRHAEVIAEMKSLNNTTERNRISSEISNKHLAEISEFNRIQAHAQREWHPIGGHRVMDKSGRPVD